MFQVEVLLSKQEYGRALAALSFRRLWGAYIILGVLLIFQLFRAEFQPHGALDWSDFLVPILLLIVLVLVPLLQAWLPFGWKSHPTIAQHTRYTFSDDGVSVTGENFSSTHSWDNFTGVKELGGAVVLFFTGVQAYVLPPTAFRTAESRTELLHFIRTHIPEAKQRRFRTTWLRRALVLVGVWAALILVMFVILVLFKP